MSSNTEVVIRRCSVKKVLLKNFPKFTGKKILRTPFFIEHFRAFTAIYDYVPHDLQIVLTLLYKTPQNVQTPL